MQIWSPVATGNGAFVIHKTLSSHIPGYAVRGYSPRLSYAPPVLYGIRPAIPPDIVHTTPDYAVFFNHHAPTVITFHNYVLDAYMRPFSSRLQNLHYRTDLKVFTTKIVKNPNVTITAVSKFVADLIEDELRPDHKVHVIYNGIDTDAFYPDRERIEHTSRLKVLFSGNLTLRKGAQWLEKIAKNIESFADIYIASGLRTNRISFSSGNVVMLGHVPYQKMPELYRRMDVLLFPTVREGFGLAATEAMASGLPVVCSNCSSLKEIVVHEKGGYLVPTGNIDSYCEALYTLATSRFLNVKMGIYNRQRILENFPLSTMIQSYSDLFKNSFPPSG